jgi:hypothetical protein
MPTVKLTAAFVGRATVTPGQDKTIYWDQTTPSFGLRVTKSGHRCFVIQYRASRGRGGTDRRLTIGAGLPLDVARREAKKLLGQVAAGVDPLGERRKAERAKRDTLNAIVEEYLKREGDRLRTIAVRRAVLERLVVPQLGSRQIDDINRADITRLLDRIADENGAPMADHVLAYLSAS